MQETNRGALRRVAVVLALAAVGLLTVGAGQAFAAGTLEICKSSLNGMSGREFQYSINGGAGPTVKGGACSRPFSVAAGNVTITELQTDPATDVVPFGTSSSGSRVFPSGRLVSQDPNARSVTVSVLEGSTAANETLVRFVNEPAGGTSGDLKVCKESETPGYWGRPFSFTATGAAAFSVEAAPPGDPGSCVLVRSYQVGSFVTVDEIVPAGSFVFFIDVSDGRDVAINRDEGTALVEIGPGVTVVTFDNEPIPPAGEGFIEVCKDAGYLNDDPGVLGVPFQFNIPDAVNAADQNIEVRGGQCSPPILVPAGIVRVTEQALAGFSLLDIYCQPASRVCDENIINRTADVEVVVASDPDVAETIVRFVNERDRGRIKLCKFLTSSSSALANMTFTFEITDLGADPNDPSDDQKPIIRTIRAGAAGSTQCIEITGIPTGNSVSIREVLTPAEREFIQPSGEGTFVVGSNTTITIRNQAMGWIQVCKLETTDLTQAAQLATFFSFQIDNGPAFQVSYDKCSPPMQVTAGNHVVKEAAKTNHECIGITTSPPGRLVSTSPSNLSSTNPSRTGCSATVTVVAGGIADETIVSFENRVVRGQYKVCKQISPGSTDTLWGTTFPYRHSVNGVAQPPFTLTPTAANPLDCSSIFGPFPVLNSAGGPTTVVVQEVIPAGAAVSSITYAGAGMRTDVGDADGRIDFFLGRDMNIVTYTNRTAPAGG